MAPFLPIRATSRSQAVRIGKQTVKTGTTTYVDVGSQTESGGIKAGSSLPYSPFKELQNHLAIGAIIVVGALTQSNQDTVVERGVKSTAGVEKLTVSSGALVTRSTGAEVEVAGVKEEATGAAPGAGKYRVDLVEVKLSTGAVKQVEGEAKTTLAAAEAAAGKLDEGYLAVALLKFSTTGKTPVVVEVAPRA